MTMGLAAEGRGRGERGILGLVKRPVFIAVAALVVLLGASGTAAGQAGSPLPGMMPGGALLPAELGRCCDGYRVGHWVEYVVHLRERRQVWHLHLAVVGREGEAWWIEMTVAQARGGEAIARMLVHHGDEADQVGGRLRRLIVQPEGQVPLELPVEEASGTLPEIDSGEGPGVLVGAESIRVGAGTFRARHYRRGEGPRARHIWLSDRVPLWGLTRYRGPRVEMSLTAMGAGAASRVTAEPIPFDPSTLR